ncbi:MAG: DUF2283 domain-containing protein [Dehalococcoidia bacterium]
MMFEYDSEADALYVHIARRHGTTRGRPLDDRRTVYHDQEDRIVGVEFLQVSLGIDLDGVPEGERVAAALAQFPRVAA